MEGVNTLTAETLAMLKTSLGGGIAGTPEMGSLQKNVTVSTGLVWYDLQAPAKNLYPTITPLRNMLPRVKRKYPGNATHWKAITAITGSGYNAMGWVPESQRSGTMSYTVQNQSATYCTIGEEDNLSFEAEASAEGFEDENAMVTFRLLQKMMRKEEMALLGGNGGGVQLGAAPAAPALTATGSGATLATGTYYVNVVYLTFEGYKNSSLVGGVATTLTITGADSKTFTLNGGSSGKSAQASQAITLGQTLTSTVTAPVQGTVAYAWFVGTSNTNGTLQAITTVNTFALSTPNTTGYQALTAIGSTDLSANTNYAFDGLLTQTFNTSNMGNVTYLATGATLTSSGRGSIVEIDTMLLNMWNLYNLGPTIIWVNAQEQKNITTKVLSNASGPLLRYNQDATGAADPYALVAGGRVEYYYNPFSTEGGTKIPVRIHPDVPPGTILMWCADLPTWYQSNEVPNVAEVMLRRDYYRMDWPLVTRQRQYGVYGEEVLAVYATFALGVITNITNG